MGVTPDRFPGPAIEEEMRYEDRGPGGDNDGDPTFEGALRRVTKALRFFVGGTIRQILQVRNPPAGFDELDMSGVQDGDVLAYDEFSKSLKATTGGGGLTPASHRSLDQLVHELAEDSYLEVTRDSGKVSVITYWTDSGKTQKVREVVITRSAGRVSQTVETQYDGAGVAIVGETLTTTITRSSGKVESMTMVRS